MKTICSQDRCSHAFAILHDRNQRKAAIDLAAPQPDRIV
jgi:hypothetical protein